MRSMPRASSTRVGSPDPHGRLQEVLDESERQAAREAYFDELGYYPEDAPK